MATYCGISHERSENLSLQKQTPALIIPEKFPKEKNEVQFL